MVEPRRWLVLGSGGAGKTTLALAMARTLNLPLVHLDRHYWRPGWVAPETPEWEETVTGLVARDAWIMDGNYSSTLPVRLLRAEAAVLLDPPVSHCLWGVIRRSLFRPGTRRPDLAEGCEERAPELQFLRYVAGYRRRSQPKVLRMIGDAGHVRFYHLRSRREAAEFLADLRG